LLDVSDTRVNTMFEELTRNAAMLLAPAAVGAPPSPLAAAGAVMNAMSVTSVRERSAFAESAYPGVERATCASEPVYAQSAATPLGHASPP
jgi:hypothetical protein